MESTRIDWGLQTINIDGLHNEAPFRDESINPA